MACLEQRPTGSEQSPGKASDTEQFRQIKGEGTAPPRY